MMQLNDFADAWGGRQPPAPSPFPVAFGFVLGGFLLEPVTASSKCAWRGKIFSTNQFTGGYSFVSDLAFLAPGC